MQASARNRDAFAGSTGEDQPEQQTAWRRADPGIKGSVTDSVEGIKGKVDSVIPKKK